MIYVFGPDMHMYAMFSSFAIYADGFSRSDRLGGILLSGCAGACSNHIPIVVSWRRFKLLRLPIPRLFSRF